MKQKIISIIRKPDPTFEATDYIPEEISDTEEITQDLLTTTVTQDYIPEEILDTEEHLIEKQKLLTETVIEPLPTTITPKKPTAKKIIKNKKKDDNIYDDFLVSNTNVTQVSNVNQVVTKLTTTQVSNFLSNEINSEVFTENYMTSSTKPIQPTLNRSIKKKKRGN